MKVHHHGPEPRRRWLGAALTVAGLAVGSWYWWTHDSADPDQVWRDAETALQANRVDQAIAGLARLRRLRAPNSHDHMLTAQLELYAQRPDEALAELARIPDASPLAPQARLLAGQVELRRSRLRKAEALFREAVRIDPKLVQAHKELVYIYGHLLRRKELDATFRVLSGLTPLTFDNVFHWCLTRNSVWDPKELVETLGAAVKADPDDRWTRIALAESLRTTNRPAESERMLSVFPATDPDARVIRAQIALDRNDEAGAAALLADPPADHADLNRLAGQYALSRRDTTAALRYFRAALALDPDNREGVLGLGQALAAAGRRDEAAPYLAAARDLDALGTLVQRAAAPASRNDPGLIRALGAACERVRRWPEAKAWYALLIRLDPLDADAQKALFRLEHAQAGTPEPPRS